MEDTKNEQQCAIHDVSNSFTLEDLQRAYVAGFSKHCELVNENMYEAHWARANEGFEKWVENGYKSTRI